MRRRLLELVVIGTAALTAPAAADTGRDLARVCGKSASLCESDFQSDELVRAMTASACVPADAGKAQAAVVEYLGKHPRTARLAIDKAVTASVRALWPCRK
jgi:hypothetical protein